MKASDHVVRSTTVLAVQRGSKVVIAGDGQVTLRDTVIKSAARKVRKLSDGKVVAGFAGSAADGMTLVDRFDSKLQEFSGNLTRAAVELAKEWRTDRALRRLEAILIVADRDRMFLLSGTGDVIEPDEGVLAIGSGGSYALAAARALIANSDLSARQIAEASMKIAADICVYTNASIQIEELS